MYKISNVTLVLFARKVAEIDRTRSCWRSRDPLILHTRVLTYMYALRFRCAKICRLLFLRSFPVRVCVCLPAVRQSSPLLVKIYVAFESEPQP